MKFLSDHFTLWTLLYEIDIDSISESNSYNCIIIRKLIAYIKGTVYLSWYLKLRLIHYYYTVFLQTGRNKGNFDSDNMVGKLVETHLKLS